MMRLKFSLLLLLLFLNVESHATSTSDVLCEAEMSVATKAVVALLKLTIEKQEISLVELQELITNDDWGQPLSRRHRSEGNLAIRKGLVRAASRLTPQERSTVRKALVAFIEKLNGEKSQVEQAKANTEDVIAISLPEQPQGGGFIANFRENSFGWHKGRPVYLVKLLVNNVFKVFLYDPFHSNKNHRLTELIGAKLNSTIKTSFGILYRKGRTYATVFGAANYAYDIEARRDLTLEELGFEDMPARRDSDYLVSSPLENGNSVVIVHTPMGVSRLSTLSGEESIFSREVLHPQIFDVNGVSYWVARIPYTKNQIAVKNLTTNAPTQYFHDPVGDARQFDMLAYGKETYLTFMGNLPGDGDNRLTRINIDSGETLSTEISLDFIGRPRSVMSQGVPYAYVGSPSGLVLIDLRSMNFTTVETDRGSQKEIASFEVAGRVYIYWGTKVMDLETRQVVGELNLDRNLYDVHTFEYRGLRYAIADAESSLPLLIQLTRKTPRHP